MVPTVFYGYTLNTSGTGVEGLGGSTGVYGSGSTYGVSGYGGVSYGVYGTNNTGAVGYLGYPMDSGTGVYGEADANENNGVVGKATGQNCYAVWGDW